MGKSTMENERKAEHTVALYAFKLNRFFLFWKKFLGSQYMVGSCVSVCVVGLFLRNYFYGYAT